MKFVAAILTAFVLTGAATSAVAECNWSNTTAQNDEKPLLPPEDARS